jgi:membrane-bound lytic murein transglycosylase MltF
MDELNKALFTFASYNAGPNRVTKLRAEASRRGLDPDVWFDSVEKVAAQRVGREPVDYVGNILKYWVAYKLALENTTITPQSWELALLSEITDAG